ncbi:alpha/beta hydrolase [Flavobacterium capsici]|uniref:Alpha/beta hydrolase-fold protein n=1 Tax=Flavobacterium capsici TaxID=3075618 RepID=A0AA96EUD8_9FLAO|nr:MULTISPECIES: alpha/beta hydrolase-fold protein [unclassified Flavobacterium]WNM18441.1 alpha/beta hydrolase-fold protein [Flavobacterium sp. PMR2A8]WNM22492.1 alpha/beta hydrolase-fold protein [Flavobacterium sp. PMTSA4]
MKKIIYPFLSFLSLLSSYSCMAQENDPIPAHDTFTIDSKQVGEQRVINVWVPEVYKISSDSLPVMYMADGGIKEDFPHIANTLAELIGQKKIKPMILVGIENTQRRRDLTGFTEVEKDKEIAPVVGGSEKFRAFISEELFAEVNKRYRTTKEKSIIGESLSGLFVMETFLLKPELFDNYIAFDPSFWWNNHYLIRHAKALLTNPETSKKSVWFAGSDAKDIYKYTDQLEKILTAQKSNTPKWHYSFEPKEKHSTIFRAAKVKAIVWTLGE